VQVDIDSNLDGKDYATQSVLLAPDQTHTFELVSLTASDSVFWCSDWFDFAGHRITVSNEVQNY
jgi:hypothetical protein